MLHDVAGMLAALQLSVPLLSGSEFHWHRAVTDAALRIGKANRGHRSQILSLKVRYKLIQYFWQDLINREKCLWFHSNPFNFCFEESGLVLYEL